MRSHACMDAPPTGAPVCLLLVRIEEGLFESEETGRLLPRPVPSAASAEERAAHLSRLRGVGKVRPPYKWCLWLPVDTYTYTWTWAWCL